MDRDATLVQPGWTVWTSDGEEFGTVATVEGETFTVKHRGLLSEKLFTVPRTAVTAVETGRVDLSMTRNELEKGR